MDYILEINKLKQQQRWLVQRGRLLLNRKEKVMDLGNGWVALPDEVEEGLVVADLIHFIDFIINESEGFDVDSLTIGLKKNP